MLDVKPDSGSGPPSSCLNCGEKLLGAFCWRCGQEAADLHRPLRALISELLDNVLNLDSKLLRTVVPLLFRPGRLTREHTAGRRVPYVRPLRLYLLASLLCFGVLALWPQQVVQVRARQEPESGAPAPSVDENPRLSRGFERALADPQKFGQAIAANFPRGFFLLLPFFALLLKLLYMRRRILYLDHLVFALHYHAFTFVALTVVALLGVADLPPPVRVPLVQAVWLWVFVYLLLALRTVYRDSWLLAGLRFGALLISYGFVFVLALVGLIFVTVYWF